MHACAVVVEAEGLGVDAPAGVAEGAGGAGALAIGLHALLRDGAGGRVHAGDQRALDVRHQDRARAVGVDEVQHLVDAGAVGVAAEHVAAAVGLQHLAVAIGEGVGADAVHRLRLPPARGVVGIAHGVAAARGRDQPVLGVIAVGEGAVGGEVAIAVVGRARRSHRGVLVQVVGAVGDAARAGRGIRPVGVVAGGLVHTLVHLVVPVIEHHRARGGRRHRAHAVEDRAIEAVEGVVIEVAGVLHAAAAAGHCHGRDRDVSVGVVGGDSRARVGELSALSYRKPAR